MKNILKAFDCFCGLATFDVLLFLNFQAKMSVMGKGSVPVALPEISSPLKGVCLASFSLSETMVRTGQRLSYNVVIVSLPEAHL